MKETTEPEIEIRLKEANDCENRFFNHLAQLKSTVGESNPRTQLLNFLSQLIQHLSSPINKTFLLDHIICSKNAKVMQALIKPDIIILKQYKETQLSLAYLQLVESLTSSSIHIQNELVKNYQNVASDPCQQLHFSNAANPNQEMMMKLILIQALKLQCQKWSDHTNGDLILGDQLLGIKKAAHFPLAIQYLEHWENFYKANTINEPIHTKSTILKENALSSSWVSTVFNKIFIIK